MTSDAKEINAPKPLGTIGLSFVKFVGIVVVYVLVGRWGRAVDFVSEDTRVFFPQAGIGLAALLVYGLRYWPAVAVGSALNLLLTREPLTFATLTAAWTSGNLLKHILTTDPAAYALIPYVTAGNTLSALAAAYILQRVVRFDLSFGNLNDVLRYLLYAVMLAPLISAAFAVARFLELLPQAKELWTDLFFRRWLGHAVSNLVVAPAFITWSRLPQRKWTRAQIAELGALLLGLAGLGIFVFTRTSPVGSLNYPVSYAPFPLILWAALRFGPRGASTAALLIAWIVVYGSSQGAGPFMREQGVATNIVLIQIYLMVIAGTGLIVASAATERERAMQNIRRSQEELRRLAEKVEEAREVERAHLARELHDELAQLLAAIRIGVTRVAKMNADHPEALAQCHEISTIAQQAVDSLRSIARNLRPGILDDLGIIEAIRWQLSEFEKRYGITTVFEPPKQLACEPDRQQRTALFRILQESLTNIAKHAHASTVVVKFETRGNFFVMEVLDNGVGIDVENLDRAEGLGIVGMRERAAALGGTCEVANAADVGLPRSGTMLRVNLPIDRALVKTDPSL